MMFRLFILIFLSTFAISCDDYIATSDVPSVVENTFKSYFPDATDVEWETHGDAFEVDFEVNRTDYSARINDAGNLLDYKYEIGKDALPSSVIAVLQTEYSKKTWEDPKILVSGENSYYQIEIDGFLNDKKIVLDSTGKKIETIKYWN